MVLQANTPTLSVFLMLCLTFISSRCDDQSNQRGKFPRSGNQIKMAVQPQCGTLSSDKFVNFNTGINLGQIKVSLRYCLRLLGRYCDQECWIQASQTIYSFGDSWTSNGNFKGGVPEPAVPKGTEPHYGGWANTNCLRVMRRIAILLPAIFLKTCMQWPHVDWRFSFRWQNAQELCDWGSYYRPHCLEGTSKFAPISDSPLTQSLGAKYTRSGDLENNCTAINQVFSLSAFFTGNKNRHG
jgi:hypothetical protein